MIFLITVRDLRINKHFTNRYVIVSMYFFNKNKNENIVKTFITREIHLIDDLKTNVFIENDILSSKKFDIFVFTLSIYIGTCDVIILISVKNILTVKTTSIYVIRLITISS